MRRTFRNVTGSLAGTPVYLSPNEIECAWSQLDADKGPRNLEASGVERPGKNRMSRSAGEMIE